MEQLNALLTDQTGAVTQTAVLVIIALLIGWRIRAIIRVAKDIHARTDKTALHLIAIIIMVVSTPIIGLPLYRLIRPTHYKNQTHDRHKALCEQTIICVWCKSYVPKETEHCHHCGDHLVMACRQCKKSLPRSYAYCAACGAPNIDHR